MSSGSSEYPLVAMNPVPVEALQSDGYMVPGQGYWIFMKDEGTYASIENVYNADILADANGGIGTMAQTMVRIRGLRGFDPSNDARYVAGRL